MIELIFTGLISWFFIRLIQRRLAKAGIGHECPADYPRSHTERVDIVPLTPQRYVDQVNAKLCQIVGKVDDWSVDILDHDRYGYIPVNGENLFGVQTVTAISDHAEPLHVRGQLYVTSQALVFASHVCYERFAWHDVLQIELLPTGYRVHVRHMKTQHYHIEQLHVGFAVVLTLVHRAHHDLYKLLPNVHRHQ